MNLKWKFIYLGRRPSPSPLLIPDVLADVDVVDLKLSITPCRVHCICHNQFKIQNLNRTIFWALSLGIKIFLLHNIIISLYNYWNLLITLTPKLARSISKLFSASNFISVQQSLVFVFQSWHSVAIERFRYGSVSVLATEKNAILSVNHFSL